MKDVRGITLYRVRATSEKNGAILACDWFETVREAMAFWNEERATLPDDCTIDLDTLTLTRSRLNTAIARQGRKS